MKLVTYRQGSGAERSGALVDNGNTIVDLLEASSALHGANGLPVLGNIQSLIEGGDEALDAASKAVLKANKSARLERAAVTLLAPLQPPPQMRDCLCFEGHLIQAGRNAPFIHGAGDSSATKPVEETLDLSRAPETFYNQPIYYKANRFAVVGTDHDIIWPNYSTIMDFELEFGIYIKKRAKDISKENAREYIFGYTILNDFTARDAQFAEMAGYLGPAKGKDFDTANAMGPCLVTADEILDPYNLTMIARINGEEFTRGNSKTMYWSFEDVIAHITRSETLYPGEFLGSGTVENGCGLEHLRFLHPNDVIELEVEGIGILRNRLVRR